MIPTTRAIPVAASALLVTLTVTGCGGFGQDVAGYVGSTYPRSAALDQGTARAYTAPGDWRSVTSGIATAKRPLDRLDAGGSSYLQYQNVIVRVASNGPGSLIRVDSYSNGYRRWAPDVASRWGAIPPDDDFDGK